jgi:exopolysaccharide biosynthesis polyprenyl glycosylphosphotransferase
MVADIAAMLLGMLLVGLLYLGTFPAQTALLSAQLLMPLFLTVGIYNGTYSIRSLCSLRFANARALNALSLSVALLFLFMFLAKTSEDFSRVTIAAGLICAGAAMAAVRWGLTRFVGLTWGPKPTNVLVIHDGGGDINLRHAYHVNAAEHGLTPSVDDHDALNTIGLYFRNMDRVIISCPIDRRMQWAAVLRAAGVRGEVTSDALHELGAMSIQQEEDFTSLVIANGPLGLRARVIKRAMDVSLAGLGLLLVSPSMALIALAIRLEDGGPIFFRQRRLGRGNCYFEIYKFRSMSVANSDHQGIQSASRDDQRVTRIGRFLRRTSLDEVPQLFNVLTGEMSLVGPRPHALGSRVDDQLFWDIESRYWDRHSLKPGLTGLAQIKGLRGATDVASDLTERVRYDLEYIRTWSPWRDLWIMAMTCKVLLHEKAY